MYVCMCLYMCVCVNSKIHMHIYIYIYTCGWLEYPYNADPFHANSAELCALSLGSCGKYHCTSFSLWQQASNLMRVS